jgi:cell division protein ZapD
MQIHRYEHPLNEKVRIYLRLEHLLKQLHDSSELSDPWQYTIFFNALFDLLELIEQINSRLKSVNKPPKHGSINWQKSIKH